MSAGTAWNVAPAGRARAPGSRRARRAFAAAALAAAGLGLASGAAAQSSAAPRPAPSAAAAEPLWELGIGAFAALGPNYPASGGYGVDALPAPIVIYRGEVLRIGGGSAVEIVPIETDRYRFGVSADASFGADSEDDGLREGLPDLDPLFEVGPEFVVWLAQLERGGAPARVELALQGRAVFSADFDAVAVDYVGMTFEPQLRVSQPGVFGPRSFGSAAIGPLFATEGLHDYFYEVDPQFARPGRPAFAAEGGYFGTEVNLGLGYQFTERLRGFSGLEFGLYSGAANADSPLWEESLNASAFVALSYSLFQSEARAKGR